MEGIVNFTIGTYKGLNIQGPDVIVTDEELQNGLMNFIDPYLKIISKDNVIENGDYIEISYEMKDEKGDDIPHGNKDHYSTRLGFGYLIDDFEEQLIGLRKGDTVHFEMTLPYDYRVEHLQNKNVSVRVSILEVKHKEMVDITDTYIESLELENIKTVKELTIDIKKKIYTSKLLEQSHHLVNEIVAKVLDDCRIEYDEDVVNYYAHNAFEEYIKNTSATDPITLFSDHDETIKNEMIAKYREETKTTLLELALFDTIIEKEQIVLDEEEKNNAIDSYCKRAKKSRESVNVKDIKKSVLYNKVVEFLVRENIA